MAGTRRGGHAEAGAGPGGPQKSATGQNEPGGPGADHHWLAEAVELSRRCPPSESAFSVGAILVGADGEVIATGFSRERDPHDHAEEVALAKAREAALAKVAPAGISPAAGSPHAVGSPHASTDLLAGTTLYSSLEPCAARASRPHPCAELIIAAGVRRVVIAWLEPPVFVEGGGAGRLRAAGITVIEIPELAAAARAVNAHLLPG
jgi:diaminohydroxyphosphoribosylaminopyrimidine deaminase/5-amino-6-(5-phosphoribosylamino)uracil reductase